MGNIIFIHKTRQKFGDVVKKVHFHNFRFPIYLISNFE